MQNTQITLPGEKDSMQAYYADRIGLTPAVTSGDPRVMRAHRIDMFFYRANEGRRAA